MALADRLEELRDYVLESDDEEIGRQRDLLLGGEEQPVYEVRASFPVLDDVVEIPIGDFVDIQFELDPDFLTGLSDDGESRAMLVVRQRSLTDNTFRVLLQLGPEGNLESQEDVDEATFLIDISFFDHAGDDHELGDLLDSDGPLGHWFIDSTQVLTGLREVVQDGSALALRISPREVHAQVEATVPFTVGMISLDIIPGITQSVD